MTRASLLLLLTAFASVAPAQDGSDPANLARILSFEQGAQANGTPAGWSGSLGDGTTDLTAR